MDCSTPGLPVLHCLQELAQTHVHWVHWMEWCHPTISFSVVPFSSCLQSFPASGSFPMSRLFASGSPSIGASASASVLRVRWTARRSNQYGISTKTDTWIKRKEHRARKWTILIVFVQWLSHVWFFATPWTAARQAPLSSTMSQSLLKFMSIESVMLSNLFILCHLPLLLPSVFSSSRVFSNESALRIR